MLHHFVPRLGFFRSLVKSSWVRIALPIWAFVATYDTFISEALPPSWSEKAPKLYGAIEMTSHLIPWYGWIIILLSMMVLALFEFAFRQKLRSEERRVGKE